jgi:YggT family protein
MTPTESLIQHWWFHIPNLLLAAMIYTVIGRYILELVFGDKDVVIVNVFRSVTDPVIKLVRLITPAVVPNGVVIVFTLMWLMAARMLWFLTAVAAGMSPSVGV